MVLCMVASPLHVLSYGGAPSLDPTKLLHKSASQAAKEKMIKDSGNEFTKQLFDEFDIDVYDASLPVVERAKAVSKSKGEAEDVGFLAAAAGIIGTVNTAVSIATKIISFFGKQYSERLVGSFTNNGYTKFQGSAKIMHGQGLPYSNVPRFLELLGKSRGIPSKYKDELQTIGKWAQYTSRSDLTKQTIEFSAGSGGSCKVLQFYIQNNREQQKLEVFILTVENSFKLAPNVFVILEETSQFWGAKSSAKIRFKKVPANLKPDQIKFVSDYFSLIALEHLADFLNVQNGVPNMKPKKSSGSSNDEILGGDSNDEIRKNLRVPPKYVTHSKRTIWRNNLKAYHPPTPQVKKNAEYVKYDYHLPRVYRGRPRPNIVYDQGELEVNCAKKCTRFNQLSPFGHKKYRSCKNRCQKSLPLRDEYMFVDPFREEKDGDLFDTISARRPSRPRPYRPIPYRPRPYRPRPKKYVFDSVDGDRFDINSARKPSRPRRPRRPYRPRIPYRPRPTHIYRIGDDPFRGEDEYVFDSSGMVDPEFFSY
jgi:hypothetical protein